MNYSLRNWYSPIKKVLWDILKKNHHYKCHFLTCLLSFLPNIDKWQYLLSLPLFVLMLDFYIKWRRFQSDAKHLLQNVALASCCFRVSFKTYIGLPVNQIWDLKDHYKAACHYVCVSIYLRHFVSKYLYLKGKIYDMFTKHFSSSQSHHFQTLSLNIMVYLRCPWQLLSGVSIMCHNLLLFFGHF